MKKYGRMEKKKKCDTVAAETGDGAHTRRRDNDDDVIGAHTSPTGTSAWRVGDTRRRTGFFVVVAFGRIFVRFLF